jgi:hypothetical protein
VVFALHRLYESIKNWCLKPLLASKRAQSTDPMTTVALLAGRTSSIAPVFHALLKEG